MTAPPDRQFDRGALASALYVGHVGHTRHRPVRHVLRYRVFMLLLDLDELERLANRLRTFSLGRFNLVSFRPRDHGDGSTEPLRRQVERHLREAGLAADGGPIRLLCLPRVLGYVFNPLSVYFCHRQDGALSAILYEVSSTFGERHSYVIPAGDGGAGEVRQTAEKRLHVSPFMDMALHYEFRVTPPGERLRVAIEVMNGETSILSTSFIGRRRPLDDATLLAAWFAHPLLTLKVIAAIHWEALRLMAKGLRLRAGPKAPADPVSLGALSTEP